MKKLIAVLLSTVALTAIASPVKWKFVKVIDGDTISFTALGLPTELQKVSVRILGIDTPESTYLAKCDKEKEAGIKAKQYLTALIGDGKNIIVDVKGWDKYGGRVLGYVFFNQKSVSDIMIEKGFARPYDGGKKSDWCN